MAITDLWFSAQPETKLCNCEVHLRVDKELTEQGHERLACLGHGGDCPCSLKAQDKSVIIEKQ